MSLSSFSSSHILKVKGGKMNNETNNYENYLINKYNIDLSPSFVC